MIEWSKYFTDMMKKEINKLLVMAKEYDEGFENSLIVFNFLKNVVNVYVNGNVKVRNHCHITG